MGIRRKKPRNQNLGLGLLFLFLVGFLILLSLVFKVASVVRSSNFDGENRFTLAILKKNPQLISFSPKEKTIYILKLVNPPDRNLGRLLAVPIDSSLSSESLTVDKIDTASDIFNLILSLRDKDTNLTSIDALRLFLFTRTVEEEGIEEEVLSSFSLSDVRGVTLNNFIDPKIVEEKIKIEIVNATDIPGLANRLANYITNMGGNVILISTADGVINDSEIKYFGDETYTASKLKKLLGFKYTNIDKKNTISDVIITIGQKEASNLPF
jgi:hypothetical protein